MDRSGENGTEILVTCQVHVEAFSIFVWFVRGCRVNGYSNQQMVYLWGSDIQQMADSLAYEWDSWLFDDVLMI